MCDVCKRKHGDLAVALENFLGDGWGVQFNPIHDGWEDLTIFNLKTKEKFKLTADGDEGGYFHYEPPGAIDYNALAKGSDTLLRNLAIMVMSEQTGDRSKMSVAEEAIKEILRLRTNHLPNTDQPR